MTEPINFKMPVDHRTREQKIGEPDDEPVRIIKANGVTDAMVRSDKQYKARVKHIFAEHSEHLSLALVNIALDPGEKTKDRIEAARIALHYVAGRPQAARIDDHAPVMPVFNIKIGENTNPIVTATVEMPAPQLIEYDVEDEDDGV